MKKIVLILFAYFFGFMTVFGQSENSCQEETNIAIKHLVGSMSYAQNIERGIAELKKIADEGCVYAQLKLGETYKKAQYVEFDGEQSFAYTKLAADQGNYKAKKLLSKLCKQGIACNLNADERLDLYTSLLDSLPCEKKTKKAFAFIKGTSDVDVDIEKGVELLERFADQGCIASQYRLGKLYKLGYFDDKTLVNPGKAFKYFSMAADLGDAQSHAHLGHLYARGIGCNLDLNKAHELYQTAYDMGNDMGAYCIGYDYMKGIGNIEQDYNKAIEWFKKSEYPMARHWLAVLHYFGYGTPIDKLKAYELLLSNDNIRNSPRLLEHLDANSDSENSILSEFKGADIEAKTEEVNKILTAVEDEETQVLSSVDQELTVNSIEGEWTGKLIELDWSGEQIVRDFPITLSLREDIDTGGVAYTATVNNSSSNSVGILLDDSLYFQDFKISLPKLYKDNLVDNIEVDILSADLEVKKIKHLQYMTAFLDSKILNWNEQGTPMLMVLTNSKIATDNGYEISEELIEALLNSQGENFITLYPNPFKNDLLIQYELTQESYSSVELYSLDGSFYKKIVDNELQPEGDKLFYFDGTALQSDLYYVVKVTTNNKAYTKMIIKE